MPPAPQCGQKRKASERYTRRLPRVESLPARAARSSSRYSHPDHSCTKLENALVNFSPAAPPFQSLIRFLHPFRRATAGFREDGIGELPNAVRPMLTRPGSSVTFARVKDRMQGLSSIITSVDPNTRNQSLDVVCRTLSVQELLQECAALEALRRRSDNLYERVRALFFLYAIHRFHLPFMST